MTCFLDRGLRWVNGEERGVRTFHFDGLENQRIILSQRSTDVEVFVSNVLRVVRFSVIDKRRRTKSQDRIAHPITQFPPRAASCDLLYVAHALVEIVFGVRKDSFGAIVS